jgi:hypothetical protein
MRPFDPYMPDIVPEDTIRNAIRADGGGEEWALDWVGGDGSGPGWWRVMWGWKDEKWPRPERAAMFMKRLEERGLVAFPVSSMECVLAIHRVDRALKP